MGRQLVRFASTVPSPRKGLVGYVGVLHLSLCTETARAVSRLLTAFFAYPVIATPTTDIRWTPTATAARRIFMRSEQTNL